MNNIGDLLARRARLNPNREAYVDGASGARLSFDGLNLRSNRAANMLTECGVRAGERVGLLLRNCAEFVELYFGLAKLGAICVPLNWRLTAEELDFILRDAGAMALIYAAEFDDCVGQLHPRLGEKGVDLWIRVAETAEAGEFSRDYQSLRDRACSAEPSFGAGDDDVLFIMYTSGTTGSPKGVVHTHNTCFWSALTFAATHDLRDGDRYLASLPMFHVGSLTPITVNVYRGATSVVMSAFDPDLAWQIIERERVTTALLVPAMLNFMIQSPMRGNVDFSSLRWVQAGAAPVPVQLIRDYADLGIEVHQIYGLTESGGPACLIDAEHALLKIGSTGKAFFHTEVKVADENGVARAPDEPGEIWIRGKHLMARYWNQPEATAEVLRDGWLRTGDGATQDADGYIFIQDRLKDMIISGGENVYPAEIENVLISHPEIREVAVIGQPSARWGESPFAVVVRTSNALTEEDILRHCDGKLARFKRPVGVAFVDAIPRNPSGKILKRMLRQQFPGAVLAPGSDGRGNVNEEERA